MKTPIKLASAALALSTLAACSAWTRTEAPQTIPGDMVGRWGLTENDCDPSRADNKGLMVVSETGLAFYESRAQLGRIDTRSDSEITAVFDFTGEGMQWRRIMTLQLDDDTLTRLDSGGDLAGRPLDYRACD